MRQPSRSQVQLFVLAGYGVVSFLFFGLRLLILSGKQFVGPGDDPQIAIWSFAWWPHAIAHGENPFITHAIWAPDGVNLTWATTEPLLALVLSPVTALAGPVAAYNVATIAIPALAAWTAYLLCRYLTDSLWAALVGGYLFGFSSYMLGQQLGHLQMISVVFIPLLALLVVRLLNGEIGRMRFALWGGLLLALQLLCSTELEFTSTLALVAGLVLAFLVVPERRRALLGAVGPILLAYVVAGILASPFLYYAATGLRIAAFQPPQDYLTDLLNLVVPTRITALGAGWAASATRSFAGNDAERDAFLGYPALLIAGLYLWRRRASGAARFLGVSAVVAAFVSLGPQLTVNGHRVIPLPSIFGHDAWTIPGAGTIHVSLFNNVLPSRLMLYAAFAVAVTVALWTASEKRRRLRVILPVLAVLAVAPNVATRGWSTTYSVPPFFTNAAYRPCLPPGTNLLPLPIGIGGDAMLWQVSDDFRFQMAGGRIATSPPSSFLHPPSLAQISAGYAPGKDETALLRSYIAAKGVTAVVVDPRAMSIWAKYLAPIAAPHEVGGIVLYEVGGHALPANC